VNPALTSEEKVCFIVTLGFAFLFPLGAGSTQFALATGLGSALLGVTALADARGRRELLALGIFLPIALLIVGVFNDLIVEVTPHTLDSQLLRFDRGVSPAIYHWVGAHPACRALLFFVYCGLPLAAAIVLAAGPRRLVCGTSLLLAGLLAPVCYFLFPATGPAYIGLNNAPRNCIPSLHMTWAFLLVLYARPILRIPITVFAILTAVATLGLGEHYVLDLILAIPYTGVILLLQHANPVRLILPWGPQESASRVHRAYWEGGPGGSPADPGPSRPVKVSRSEMA